VKIFSAFAKISTQAWHLPHYSKAEGSMENDDEYEGIFNDDEVVDVILYDKVEKELDEKKNTGCFTTILAISGGAQLGFVLLLLI
jgi:hypothetical protein